MDKYKKYLSSVFLLPVALFLIYNKGHFIFILDHVNTLFHEGGHGIFKVFGGFIYTLGGTLMQIIIPGLFIFYFYINKKLIGVQISVLYLAENLMNISVYIGDARARILPLLGGNKVYHDWHYLLRETNLLESDTQIASIVYILGVIISIIALILPVFHKEYKQVKLDLNL